VKEMGHVKMAGPSFVNDVYSMMTQFCSKKHKSKQEPDSSYKHDKYFTYEQFKEKLSK
jgi:hypothetical protein